MSDSMTNEPGAPAPVFEGSEKRLEVHFTSSHAIIQTPSCGLRALSRATLDELMTFAACEILSSTSNRSLDAYVLSESSLFVYPTTWILKTCGNTRPLACLEKLLSISAQHGLKPSYVKYSHASFLHPLLQPVEYQCFPSEVEVLRKHLGHLGNGGSAYQLGDSLSGLQWHVFVASAPGFVPSMTCSSDSGMPGDHDNDFDSHTASSAPGTPTGTEASDSKAPNAPLRTLEVCMTELGAEAAQQFVRTPAFQSSAHTTKETGIDTLLPGCQLDDHMFEPCGYSMNGIKDSQLVTVHVTPEEDFSYASCEIHGFTEPSVDPSATVASLTSIFAPGRFVIAYGTSSTFTEDAPPYITLRGYCCVGASCQALPAGGAVYFMSYVRDTFRPPRSQDSPQALRSFPTFSMLSSAAATSAEGLMQLSVEEKPACRKLGSCTTASSASDMDVHVQEDCCVSAGTAAETHSGPSNLTAVQYACELIETTSPCDTFFLVDMRPLAASLAAWHAALPSVKLCHRLRCCGDAAVLRHMHERGVSFIAEAAAHVEELSAAGVAMGAAAASVSGWRSREVRRAIDLSVSCFRVASLHELELLQRSSGASGVARYEVHIVISDSDDSTTLWHALTGDEAGSRGAVSIAGIVIDLSGDCPGAQERVLAAAQRACVALKAAGHLLHSAALAGAELSSPKVAALLATHHAWMGGYNTAVDCELLSMPKRSVDAERRASEVQQYTIADGASRAVLALPTSVCCGDWVIWRGLSAGDVQTSFRSVDRFYL